MHQRNREKENLTMTYEFMCLICYRIHIEIIEMRDVHVIDILMSMVT